jgi:type IV pilus assembly protein PilB
MIIKGVDYIPIVSDLMQVISPDWARQFRIVPKAKTTDKLSFYIDRQVYASSIIEELEILTGKLIDLEPTDTIIIERTLAKYYLSEDPKARNAAQVVSAEDGDFLQRLIKEARSLGSSDIHIETYEERCRIRIRIDGQMAERYVLNKGEYPTLINKIKIMSNLDISEKRLPQDGRIFFAAGTHKFDIRVSVLPTLYGEKVVMRILSNDATNIDIKQLGFGDIELQNYLEGVKRPNGIILISGPTGSGKTTTLYATLKLLNKESNNILTIEDPIEYTLEGINQVQLKESIGLNFASALRTFLRQDPDIIMVGEIRDTETANMAIRASLTGHLVLSTIHTNSAWGTISRLIDMGVPPFLLASTLNTSVAQRLVRKLCTHCKQEQAFDDNLYPKHFRPTKKITTHFVAKGCDHCFFVGYRGRKAIYEVIPIDTEFSDKIKNNQHDISDLLHAKRISTLTENAFQLFEQGETSIEEIYSLLFTA